MKDKTERPELCLFVKTTEETGYTGEKRLQFDISVCKRNRTDDAPHGISCYDFDTDDPARGLAYLAWTFTAYSEDAPGWNPTIDAIIRDADYVTVDRLRPTIVIVDKYRKHLDKINAIAGYASTPGAALQRIGSALKLSGIIRRHPQDAAHWQYLELEHTASVIDREVSSFYRRRHEAPQPESATSAA